jgi:hypothetical protein
VNKPDASANSGFSLFTLGVKPRDASLVCNETGSETQCRVSAWQIDQDVRYCRWYGSATRTNIGESLRHKLGRYRLCYDADGDTRPIE